ncbi:MAG: NADH-quinone oxidoreductase subunit J [Dehalococcoidia bacterium]
MEAVLFYSFAGISVVGGVLMTTRKNPVYSAVYLVLTLVAVAGLFILLNAQFLAAIQVAVYAGAIVVLFLFVIMLLNLKGADLIEARPPGLTSVAGLAVLVLLVEMVLVGGLGRLTGPLGEFTPQRLEAVGNTQAIGQALFSKFLLPFEVISLVLLVAMVGAVVLDSHRRAAEAGAEGASSTPQQAVAEGPAA